MMKRFALVAPLLLAAAPPASNSPAAPDAASAAADVYVAIETTAGTITLDLEETRAPLTTANFLKYVDAERFDGTAFYRSMHLDWGEQPNGLIQGGIAGTPTRAFPPVAHEPTSETGVLHKAGTISLARFAPGTGTGDFSIMVSDMPGLDADPESDDPETRAGFAAFGHVVEGMDVVRAIWDAPLSATKGEGALKGQMIENPVKIVSARRVEAPEPAPARNEMPEAP
ncbi:peptidylprolyl isomerase [Novosphingobium sp. PC22D]|uniref:peptidylprolyl isomerase n=1 Tax=Novosphingobium sp. PC22D TaxID=1962403 RepID=UPI000BF23D87|nr:peptidylprolyl isomerase [Novosphingobium sp. PC22D]PEQ14719.1 peptidylprolyl isomerase [Novosphingobium sp. PC22D]